MKSDLSIPTPAMLLTRDLFYSSNGRFARVANRKTTVVIGNQLNRTPRANRNKRDISRFDRWILVNSTA